MGGGKLLIISGFSPSRQPTGGVAMHTHRLVKKVVEPYFDNYEVCDYQNESKIIQFKKIKASDIIHVHVSNPYGRLAYVAVAKLLGKKTILTIHGNYGRFNKRKNFVDKMAIKLYDVPILINEESYEKVVAINGNAVFIPAFIPPIVEEETLSHYVSLLIDEIKKDGHPLFITNASRRAFTDKGEEIYGIGFLVDFFKEHPEYNLLFMDPKGHYIPFYEGKLPSNVHLLTGPHSFCGMMEKADIVIRNTPTDGDSFSVKEGLCYHKRVLASDSVSRPEGVFLFKYNDSISFAKAIQNAFTYKGQIELKGEDSIAKYLELYSRMGVC